MEILWDIVEESLDEAEFLWSRRQAGLEAHDLGLDDLFKWTEDRLLGNLEGVSHGGPRAVDELLAPALGASEPGRVAAAAYLLAANPAGHEALLSAFGTARGDRLDWLRQGIELSDNVGVERALEPRLRTAGPRHRAAFLELKAFRREDPGAHLLPLLSSDDVVAQTVAARAARHCQSDLTLSYNTELALQISSPAVRNVAIESGLVAGHPTAWNQCLAVVSETPPDAGPLLTLVALLGTAEAHQHIVAALDVPPLERDAVWALGFAGTVAAAELSLDLLRRGRQPRLAGEAFCAITGLDLKAARLVVPEPDAGQPADDDAPVRVLTSDEKLPLPDVDGVVAWWSGNRVRFEGEQRYLGGQRRTGATVQRAIEKGSNRRRPALILELAIRTRGLYRVNPRAWVARQRGEMNIFSALQPGDSKRHPDVRRWAPL